MGNESNKQSYWWYLPIVIILLFGYVIGGTFSFGIYFLNMFSSLSNPSARFTLMLFGMGLLGSTMYCTKWWASDMEEAVKDKSLLPHFFDVFGYFLIIIGGGVTGVILYLAVRAGALLTISSTHTFEPRLPFAFVISFCGGLFHFKVRDMLSGVLIKISAQSQKDIDRQKESLS